MDETAEHDVAAVLDASAHDLRNQAAHLASAVALGADAPLGPELADELGTSAAALVTALDVLVAAARAQRGTLDAALAPTPAGELARRVRRRHGVELALAPDVAEAELDIHLPVAAATVAAVVGAPGTVVAAPADIAIIDGVPRLVVAVTGAGDGPPPGERAGSLAGLALHALAPRCGIEASSGGAGAGGPVLRLEVGGLPTPAR